MRIENGYLVVGQLWGAPVRLHWSIPVAALLFSRLQFRPAFWVAFVLLVLVHEVGHAFFVRRYNLSLQSINVHGMGGDCRWAGAPTPFARAVIAWGGIVFQLGALLVALVVRAAFGPATDTFAASFEHVFISTNLWVAAFNLLPIAPLDGAEAWKIFPHIKRRAKRAAQERAAEKVAAAYAEKMKRVKQESADEANALAGLDAAVPDENVASMVSDALKRATDDVNKGDAKRGGGHHEGQALGPDSVD